MPLKLRGKTLTPKEHRQWKHVQAKTGSAKAAMAAVLKSRRKKGK